MPYLVLVRHGQSQWNALGLFNGMSDNPLTDLGVQQAKAAAKVIGDIELHQGYTSELKRAQQTLNHILETNGRRQLPVTKHKALNERAYGEYEGKSIREMEKQIGKAATNSIRQDWEAPIPGGETLKQTHDRAVAYYERQILADLKAGKNVIVAAHRNVLRTLVKYLDQMPDEQISQLTLENGEVDIYQIDPQTGGVVSKEIRLATP